MNTNICYSVDSFLYKYEDKNSYPDMSYIKINSLAKLLLDSKIKLSKNQGLYKLFVIIKNDLRNLIDNTMKKYDAEELKIKKENFYGLKLAGKLKNKFISEFTGLKSDFKAIKDILEEIIKILDNLIKKKNDFINIQKEIEEPIINIIAEKLLNNDKKLSKVLFTEILKHLFFLYVSKFGIQIHDNVYLPDDLPELKKSIVSIITFFLFNSAVGYISFSIRKISNLVRGNSKGIAVSVYDISYSAYVNKYIKDVQEKIEEHKKCKKSCSQHKICKIDEINTIDKFSILGQAVDGSILCKLFVNSEFYITEDGNFNYNNILKNLIYKNLYNFTLKYPSLKRIVDNTINTIINYIGKSIINDYDSLNRTLYWINNNLEFYLKYSLMKNIIYPIIIIWGIIPSDFKNNSPKNNLIYNSLNIDKRYYIVDNNALCKGIFKIEKNTGDVNLIMEKYSYISYYKNSQLKSYVLCIGYDYDYFINKNDILYQIYAILNKTYLLESAFLKDESGYFLYLYPNIKIDGVEYQIKLIIGKINSSNEKKYFLENKKVGNEKKYLVKIQEKTLFLNYIQKLFTNGILIKLIHKNNSFLNKTYEKIIKIRYDPNLEEFIIPKDYLFHSNELEYIIIKKYNYKSKLEIINYLSKKNKFLNNTVRSVLTGENITSEYIKEININKFIEEFKASIINEYKTNKEIDDVLISILKQIKNKLNTNTNEHEYIVEKNILKKYFIENKNNISVNKKINYVDKVFKHILTSFLHNKDDALKFMYVLTYIKNTNDAKKYGIVIYKKMEENAKKNYSRFFGTKKIASGFTKILIIKDMLNENFQKNLYYYLKNNTKKSITGSCLSSDTIRIRIPVNKKKDEIYCIKEDKNYIIKNKINEFEIGNIVEFDDNKWKIVNIRPPDKNNILNNISNNNKKNNNFLYQLASTLFF